MGNYELHADEVILYEGSANCTVGKGSLKLTLTSQKLIFEREKGIFKKELELVDVVSHEEIKVYNGVAQVKQKASTVDIQSISKNITITFNGMLEAKKFAGKLIDTVTGTTIAKRSSEKIKGAFDMIDDTLGVDTRGTVKGFLENGVKGTILNGIGKKK